MPHTEKKESSTSVATERNSAPVVLGHNRAIKSKRIPRSTLILEWFNIMPEDRPEKATDLRACIRKICARPSLSGKENSTRRSKRPGRSKAGSRVSGLHNRNQKLVAIETVPKFRTCLWP